MEIIAELEPDQRGLYAGAVGYFDFSGNLDTAIAIRTMVMKDGVAQHPGWRRDRRRLRPRAGVPGEPEQGSGDAPGDAARRVGPLRPGRGAERRREVGEMLLLIDNYDSFTYNLYQYLGELGEDVVVRRNDEITLSRGRRARARADRHLARARRPRATPALSVDDHPRFGPTIPTARRLPRAPVHRLRLRRAGRPRARC